MLDVANKYEKELQTLFMNTWYDDKYKFFHTIGYSKIYKSAESNRDSYEFVSKNSEGEICGYFSFFIDRPTYSVKSLVAVNFSDAKHTYGVDLMQVITDIFEKYNFRKLNFSVIVGNPIEQSYDRLVERYGGRVLGIYREDVKLNDNMFYDSKVYELFRDDFINESKNHKKR